MLALVLASAGNTLGYDFHCYEGAAPGPARRTAHLRRGLLGERRHVPRHLHLPATFAVVLVPWLSLGGAAAGLWCLAMAACFMIGVALLPVRRDVRWLIVIVAALDWPLLYAVKLGQWRDSSPFERGLPQQDRQQAKNVTETLAAGSQASPANSAIQPAEREDDRPTFGRARRARPSVAGAARRSVAQRR